MQEEGEYHLMQREAAHARIGADRMAAGLGCIPHKIRGDLEKVQQLLAENGRLRAALEPFAAALTKAEKEYPVDPHGRLSECRWELTLYEFAKARTALCTE